MSLQGILFITNVEFFPYNLVLFPQNFTKDFVLESNTETSQSH